MSSSEEEAAILFYIHRRRKRKRRRFSVHPYLTQNIKYSQLLPLQDLPNYPDRFYNYFRMSKESFEVLLDLVSPKITKKVTNWRKPISPQERLSITLRFLAEGSSYHQLSYEFFREVSTIAQIIPETCEAIWTALQPHFMPVPDEEQWRGIARRYKELWNMPNCLGSIEGKHICIRCYNHSGSNNFNYLNYFSTVLMASTDYSLFVRIDVSAVGRSSDGGVFHSSRLGRWLAENKLNIPSPSNLEGDETHEPFPYYFCADEAFPSREYIMRPFPRRILNNTRRVFNYRFSRARKSIECAFGLMSMKWRIFEKRIQCTQDHLDVIVQAACVLHNFTRIRDGHMSYLTNLITRNRVLDALMMIGPLDHSRFVAGINWQNYFENVSPVPYQWACMVGDRCATE